MNDNATLTEKKSGSGFMIEIKDIKSDSGNIKRFILKSEKLTVSIINYGATVTNVIYDGRDVVLGCAAAEEYPHSGYYFGATNNPRFPGIAVKKGEKYAYKTIYRFGKDQNDKNRF